MSDIYDTVNSVSDWESKNVLNFRESFFKIVFNLKPLMSIILQKRVPNKI